MKTVEALLNHKYDTKLEKHSYYKDRIAKMKAAFQPYGLSCAFKDELAFYDLEIIYESILNKERFEDTYLTTYGQLQDLWEGLDYQERRHQMNVDIDQMRATLHWFPFGQDEIYMPMFDPRMNRLYTHDIVLLELKQYQRFMKRFDDIIEVHQYGILPYLYHFTSCEFVCGKGEQFVLYDPHLHRFYMVEQQRCTKRLCLDANNREEIPFSHVRAIAEAMMEEPEAVLCELLLDSFFLEDKMKRKIAKHKKKMTK